uniref:Uncharacterized protein n=1 Tax=Anguilla anguilla TaxID=7936 RepID=A0A0E9X955_ANGAN
MLLFSSDCGPFPFLSFPFS